MQPVVASSAARRPGADQQGTAPDLRRPVGLHPTIMSARWRVPRRLQGWAIGSGGLRGDRSHWTGRHNYTGEEGPMAAAEAGWREAAEQVATGAGFDLEDFAVVAAGRRRIVRVVVDSDAGLGLDAAADLSRLLSARFDELDEAAGGTAPAYTLEVTSPGLGRPLTEPRHFRRAGGRLLSVTLADGSTRNVRVLGVSRRRRRRRDRRAAGQVRYRAGPPVVRLDRPCRGRSGVLRSLRRRRGAARRRPADRGRARPDGCRCGRTATMPELDDAELDDTDEPEEVTR